MQKILVWDWPVRIGHWLMVGSFLLAWLTSESELWRQVHALAGGTFIGIALFRLYWGICGTRHARFASFLRGPRAVLAYGSGLLRKRPQHATGHNAAGGWAIISILGLGLLTGASGWVSYQDIGSHWTEELHEGMASIMLAVVVVHMAGVITSSLAHRENLAHAMFSGIKLGRPDEAIANTHLRIIPLMLGWIAVCAWWLAR